METAKIRSCAAESCAYNKEKVCHALAITIGSSHQQCDTFMKDSQKGGLAEARGAVGACHMKICRYNQALECTAPAIVVGMHSQHADCSTFTQR